MVEREISDLVEHDASRNKRRPIHVGVDLVCGAATPPTRGTLGNADPPEVYAFTPATVWQVRRPHIRRYTNSPAGRNLWNVSRRIQFALLASSAAKSSATNAYAPLICQTAGFRCQA